ncbi:hypothetical protein D3C86_1862470 [compost metagenome]
MKMNKKITAGPPSNDAFPIVLNIPAPTIAAIPNDVKSLTLNVRCNDPSSWPWSPCPAWVSFKMDSTDFFLKRFFNISFQIGSML